MDLDWNQVKIPADFDANSAAFVEFCKRLKDVGKEVVILGPLPTYSSNRIAGYARSLRRHEEHNAVLCAHENFNHNYGRFLSLLEDMERTGLCKAVYPHAVLSSPKGYPAINNGIPMFKDADHLSVQGSIYVMNELKQELKNVLLSESDSE